MPVPQYRHVAMISLLSLSMLCRVSPAAGQVHYSARIYALGGPAVSGIIPDYYTDLMYNPAYASLSDGMTINYGQRESPTYSFPFSHFERSFMVSSVAMNSFRTNELLAHGMDVRGWKIAMLSEWYALNSDETDSYLDKYYSGLDLRNTVRTTRRNDQHHYFHGAVSISRHIGEEAILGLRLGAFDYYVRWEDQRTRYNESYEYDEPSGTTYLYNIGRQYDYDETLKRWLSPYIQIGLLLEEGDGNGSELVLKISRNDVNARREDFSLDIDNYYELVTGDQTRHYYRRSEWIDDRDGEMWSFDLYGRHAFRNGIRIFAGGAYSTASYEGNWLEARRNYEWRTFVSDLHSYQTVRGDGESSGISFFAKAGRTFRIERRIDVTAGCRGSFTRSVTEEAPVAALSTIRVYDDDYENYAVSALARFEMERLAAGLVLPLAIEFRPAGYITFFAGLNSWATWTRDTDELFVPPLSGVAEGAIPTARHGTDRIMTSDFTGGSTAENCEDVIRSGHGATFGFSLQYKDRLVFDLYSGSDITPENLEYMVLDLRYRF